MGKSIFQMTEQINRLHKKTYNIYLLLIDDVCRKYQKNYPIFLTICWILPVMEE